MGYRLCAVIASESLLRRATATTIVPLGGGLALLPMTEEFFDSVTEGEPPVDSGGFFMLPNGFGQRLAAWSVDGPVAYVEAD